MRACSASRQIGGRKTLGPVGCMALAGVTRKRKFVSNGVFPPGLTTLENGHGQYRAMLTTCIPVGVKFTRPPTVTSE